MNFYIHLFEHFFFVYVIYNEYYIYKNIILLLNKALQDQNYISVIIVYIKFILLVYF